MAVYVEAVDEWVVVMGHVTFVCIEPYDIDFFLRITTFSRAPGLRGGDL